MRNPDCQVPWDRPLLRSAWLASGIAVWVMVFLFAFGAI